MNPQTVLKQAAKALLNHQPEADVLCQQYATLTGMTPEQARKDIQVYLDDCLSD